LPTRDAVGMTTSGSSNSEPVGPLAWIFHSPDGRTPMSTHGTVCEAILSLRKRPDQSRDGILSILLN
jgi:hypothetical protein